MSKIAIIHGYGVVDMEKPFYQTYITQCADYIKKNNIDTVICSGGFTNPNIALSEAQSLQVALQDKGVETHRILEEQSLTTVENIEWVDNVHNFVDSNSYFILGSNIHIPKIIYHSEQIYFKENKLEVLENMQSLFKSPNLIQYNDTDIIISYNSRTYIWIDLHRDQSSYIKWIRSNLIESHYDEFPQLHEEFKQWRKQQRWL